MGSLCGCYLSSPLGKQDALFLHIMLIHKWTKKFFIAKTPNVNEASNAGLFLLSVLIKKIVAKPNISLSVYELSFS
ncbi:hypothetical protein T07_11891 [Trichinella nelsoni]|uniref:Uncharacterized protein n=1 Tax=Trichinella nelsoni TaxID=6336 RepID=A0A0V0RZR2_9BILA|nr:hypothetical protein T07_11891 [Trichinella nelsoni]